MDLETLASSPIIPREYPQLDTACTEVVWNLTYYVLISFPLLVARTASNGSH